MNTGSRFLVAVSLSAVMLLVACDTAEERAEGHYENAVELIGEGDVDRALIELRNVFQLNAQHVEARRLYAQTMLERGRIREAFGNYTLVSEQLPDDLDSRIRLARLAVEVQDWEEFERHATRAQQIAPDDPETEAVWLVKQFREAVVAEDAPAREAVAGELKHLLEQRPDDLLLRRVLIEDNIMAQRFSSALEEVDAALAADPDQPELMQMRLALLLQLGDEAEFETQLVEMVENDPEDAESRDALMRWYMSQGRTERAEELLRTKASAEGASTEDRVQYIAFIRQTRGAEAAREEIDTMLGAGHDTVVLRALRAGLDFDAGSQDEAIAEMEDIIAGAETSDVIRDVKVSLARLLSATGNEVGARQRIEEVLAEDATHVEALKMRAGWLIEQDSPDEAISALRTALDQAPRDSEIMTLMASAYLRSGSRELAGEMLSLAVDASNNAPEEAIRYARFLIADEKLDIAEPGLVDALRRAPGNLGILTELGRVYVGQEDWRRLEQVEASLRRLGSEEAVAAADALRLERLQREDRTEDAVALLESIIQQQGANDRAALEIVRTHLRNNDLESAEQYIDTALEENPDQPLMRFLRASIYASSDRPEEAEVIYREMLEENPRQEVIWRTLYTLLNREGRFDDARVALEEGLQALPEAANLQWALAGEFEREGDVEGAIEIYEDLYSRNSNSVVIANNLASLISTYKTDDESLDRAWSIARRLRGSDRPEFQDTYGWIALRRGETEEALQHLKPAADALGNDPLVQYHLGMAYVEAERPDEALAQLRRAVELAGPADTREQFQDARDEIRRLEELLAGQPSE